MSDKYIVGDLLKKKQRGCMYVVHMTPHGDLRLMDTLRPAYMLKSSNGYFLVQDAVDVEDGRYVKFIGGDDTWE